MQIGVGVYRPFVREELEKLLQHGTGVSRFRRALGRELWASDDYDDEPPKFMGAIRIFYLVSAGWTYDFAWFQNDSGKYLADDGELLELSETPTATPSEHLSAYGLWALHDEYWAAGRIPDDDERYNEQGWTREEVLAHQTECVLQAYQALVFAQKLLLNSTLSPEEALNAARIANAQRAADIRHSRPGGSRDKQSRIREAWATGKYSSRDICAEQECAGLGMSYSSARKALRGTPDPA